MREAALRMQRATGVKHSVKIPKTQRNGNLAAARVADSTVSETLSFAPADLQKCQDQPITSLHCCCTVNATLFCIEPALRVITRA